MAKKNVRVGDNVTCLYAVWSNDDQALFSPGMVGTVIAIAPKVVILKHADPRYYDQCPDFVVVEFSDLKGERRICGLNFVNVHVTERVGVKKSKSAKVR
jgi:hypothetical protein